MDTVTPITSLPEPISQSGGTDAPISLAEFNGSPALQQGAGEPGVAEALAISAKIAPAPLAATPLDEDVSDAENTPPLTSTRTDGSWPDNDVSTPFEEVHVAGQNLIYDFPSDDEEESDNEQMPIGIGWKARGKGNRPSSGVMKNAGPPPKPAVPKSPTSPTTAASTSTVTPTITLSVSPNEPEAESAGQVEATSNQADP